MKAPRGPEFGGNHVGAVPRFKPFRDRIVRWRLVPCPVCGAAVDEPCRKQDGTPGSNVHPRRRGLAIREGR